MGAPAQPNPARSGRPPARQGRRAFALVLVAALLGSGGDGLAVGQEPAGSPEPLTCARELGSGLICHLSASDQLDQQVRDLVESGFTNELVYRLYVFPHDDDEPVAAAAVVFAVVFQLYTDVYYISREGVEGYVERGSWVEAREELGEVEVTLDNGEELPPGEYFAAAVLEVNPVNEAQLLEARRWIAQSRGGYRLFDSRESSLFGTFVSLFVNVDLGSADARRVFRSDTFEMGP